jgi:Tol biopolymer transport system component
MSGFFRFCSALTLLGLAVGGGAACGDDDGDDDPGDGSRADARPDPDSGGGVPDGAPVDPDGAPPDAGPLPDAAPDQPARIWIHGDMVTNNREQLAAYEIGTPLPATPSVTLPPGETGSLSVFQSLNSGAYDISLDGNRIALPADIDVPGRFDLYVVSPDGSNLRRVVAVSDAADVAKARLSPDGQWIAFTADLETDGIFSAYIVPFNEVKAEPTLVSPAGATDDVDDIVWANNSESLLFTGDFTTAGRFELFIVDVTDSSPSPVSLVGPDRILSPAAQSGVLQPIQRRGNNVLFRGRLAEDNAIRLYTVAASGAGVETVLPGSEIIRADKSVANVGAVGVSANGAQIAFAADETPRAVDVWVMPTDGSESPTRITTGLTPPEAGIIDPAQQPLRWSPDGQSVAFFADYVTINKNEPFVAPVNGDGHYRVAAIGPEIADADTTALGWSPDSTQLYMVADHLVNNQADLFVLDPALTDQEPVLVIDSVEAGNLRGDITVSN